MKSFGWRWVDIELPGNYALISSYVLPATAPVPCRDYLKCELPWHESITHVICSFKNSLPSHPFPHALQHFGFFIGQDAFSTALHWIVYNSCKPRNKGESTLYSTACTVSQTTRCTFYIYSLNIFLPLKGNAQILIRWTDTILFSSRCITQVHVAFSRQDRRFSCGLAVSGWDLLEELQLWGNDMQSYRRVIRSIWLEREDLFSLLIKLRFFI